ncbi:MAG: peptide MFS transporter [Armatimonadetes bacterium]|nr:peptide MFS transporter [Armatimonadota bacterium]
MEAEIEKKGHPKGLYVLFLTEAAERFSFYTMRALLVLYLVRVIYVNVSGDEQTIRDQALAVYGMYLLLVYLSGLVGGTCADRLLGSRKAIFLGGIVMACGLFLMWWPNLLFYGLGLIVAGNGFFKPNISTIVSGLYEENDPRRDPAFTIFYMGINLGAFLAIFGAGWAEALAKQHPWGWNVGFVVAGVGMIFSLLLFHWGQPLLGTAGFPPGREIDADSRLNATDWRDIVVWAIGLSALVLTFVFVWDAGLGTLWDQVPGLIKLGLGIALILGSGGGFVVLNRDNTKEEWERVGAIIILSIFVIFFWAGFEQAGGTMNLFAFEQTDRHLFGWEMPATWFQGFNPLFIILLAPIFSKIWEWTDKKYPWALPTPAKMGLGMIVLGLGFVVMAQGQRVADDAGKAGLWWLIAVYLLHTVGELCLSPIGLSMVTKLSPVRRVSLMMGIWFACTAVADYLSGRMESIVHQLGGDLWTWLIGLSVIPGVILLLVTPVLKKWMHGRG